MVRWLDPSQFPSKNSCPICRRQLFSLPTITTDEEISSIRSIGTLLYHLLFLFNQTHTIQSHMFGDRQTYGDMLTDARNRIAQVRSTGLGEELIHSTLSNLPTVPELLICYLEMTSRGEEPAADEARDLARHFGHASERLGIVLRFALAPAWGPRGPSARRLIDPDHRADNETRIGFLILADHITRLGFRVHFQ